MTNPARQLAAVATLAEQLAHQWDTYLATTAAMSPPLLRAAGSDTGRASGHADPTLNAVLALDHHTDTLEAINAWLAQVRWIADRVLAPIRAEGPRAAISERERRLALCADPLCGRYAVARGLCKPHYDADRYRRRLHESTQGPPASHSAVLGSSLVGVRLVLGTCGRCQHEVSGETVDHVQELLDAHHASECPGAGDPTGELLEWGATVERTRIAQTFLDDTD